MKKTLLIVVIIMLAATTCAGAYSWQRASSPGIGRMATDPNGNLWLVTNDSLSRWSGSSWQTESMPTYFDRANPSIAFSQDGQPHIITQDSYRISYLTKDSSGWHQQVICDSDPVAGNTNVAVGPDGKVYTAVITPTNERQLYLMVRDTNGVWSRNLVDNLGFNTAWWPDMKIDPVSGEVVIAYTTGVSDDLKVARGLPGSWSYSTVQSSMVTGWVPQLQITSDGLSVIGYGYQTTKQYGLAMEQSDGTYKFAYAPNTSLLFSYSLSLVNDKPLMVYTQGGTSERYTSKLYCFWYQNGTATNFLIGDGNVKASIYNEWYDLELSSPDPYVSSIVVGDRLYVNFINADGSGAQTWYATVPEPSCIVALMTGLAGIGLLRRKRS